MQDQPNCDGFFLDAVPCTYFELNDIARPPSESRKPDCPTFFDII
jgi:hypothetical protein